MTLTPSPHQLIAKTGCSLCLRRAVYTAEHYANTSSLPAAGLPGVREDGPGGLLGVPGTWRRGVCPPPWTFPAAGSPCCTVLRAAGAHSSSFQAGLERVLQLQTSAHSCRRAQNPARHLGQVLCRQMDFVSSHPWNIFIFFIILCSRRHYSREAKAFLLQLFCVSDLICTGGLPKGRLRLQNRFRIETWLYQITFFPNPLAPTCQGSSIRGF